MTTLLKPRETHSATADQIIAPKNDTDHKREIALKTATLLMIGTGPKIDTPPRKTTGTLITHLTATIHETATQATIEIVLSLDTAHKTVHIRKTEIVLKADNDTITALTRANNVIMTIMKKPSVTAGNPINLIKTGQTHKRDMTTTVDPTLEVPPIILIITKSLTKAPP